MYVFINLSTSIIYTYIILLLLITYNLKLVLLMTVIDKLRNITTKLLLI